MSDYIITIMIFGGIWSILAVSLNLLTGEAGQVSLGQAAFFAIGAYTSALVAIRMNLPFVVCLVLSAVIAGVFTGVFGLLALRVREDFLVFTTIGVNFLVVALFQNFKVFGGTLGLVGMPFAEIGGKVLTPLMFAVAVALLLALVCIGALLLRRTWLGTGFTALREDEQAARMVGIPTRAFKVFAFAISGVVAGLGGGLYAFYLGSVFPQNFNFLISIQVMAMLVLGGLGTLRGAVVGALILTALRELLRPLADYRYTIFGAVLVLVVMFAPDGITGLWDRARRRDISTWPAGSAAKTTSDDVA